MKRNLRDIQRLMLISTTVVAGFELCLAVLNIFVEKISASATGLDSLQTLALLDTVRYFTQTLGTFLLPFWQIGIIRAALCKQRNHPLDGSLTFGFTRFGPVLGMYLFLGLILTAVLTTVMQVASMIFTMTPMGRQAELFLAPYLEDATDLVSALSQIPVAQLLEQMAPMFVLAAVLGIPAVYLVWCRFRFASYLVMEDDKVRAIPAMFISNALAKKQAGKFLRLDLKFWWYYLASALVAALIYADILLGLDQTAFHFVFLTVHFAAQLALAWLFQAKVELAYAEFFESRNNDTTVVR